MGAETLSDSSLHTSGPTNVKSRTYLISRSTDPRALISTGGCRIIAHCNEDLPIISAMQATAIMTTVGQTWAIRWPPAIVGTAIMTGAHATMVAAMMIDDIELGFQFFSRASSS